jgi:hypothetical protein
VRPCISVCLCACVYLSLVPFRCRPFVSLQCVDPLPVPLSVHHLPLGNQSAAHSSSLLYYTVPWLILPICSHPCLCASLCNSSSSSSSARLCVCVCVCVLQQVVYRANIGTGPCFSPDLLRAGCKGIENRFGVQCMVASKWGDWWVQLLVHGGFVPCLISFSPNVRSFVRSCDLCYITFCSLTPRCYLTRPPRRQSCFVHLKVARAGVVQSIVVYRIASSQTDDRVWKLFNRILGCMQAWSWLRDAASRPLCLTPVS